ncbi:tyrosine-type recombinase/integrase [Arthrobacter burdickii]|uniref:Site-specific integrase n=1 Tax=Arthrobacter burdickii TaxID=3035920 RepID=A0ABT8K6I9_9MICC|nr:site-specific integrase [Arthrobacter burdickii]MDN4611969.1 site-specific integrase [Arthrobacter burdickii]
MASIVERPRKSGEITYTVRWRDPITRKQDSTTTTDKSHANTLKRLLDANGQSFDTAHRILLEQSSLAPTLTSVIERHVGLLTNISVGTENKYRTYLRLYLDAKLGGRPVDSIEYDDVVAWIKWMQWEGKSAKTIANVHGLLSAAMSTAVRLKLRPENPCKSIILPKADHIVEPVTFLTHEEFRLLMRFAHPHYVPLFQFLVGTGLRMGEATALVASDFDLIGSTPSVRVSKAWKQDGAGGYYVGPPKTRRSRRTVALAPDTVAVVSPLVKRAQLTKGEVFTSPMGKTMRSGTVYRRAWHPAIIAAQAHGLEKQPRLHDLRHTHASWMLNAGTDIFKLSRRLGHESTTTTTDLYSHLLPEALESTAVSAQRAIAGV